MVDIDVVAAAAVVVAVVVAAAAGWLHVSLYFDSALVALIYCPVEGWEAASTSMSEGEVPALGGRRVSVGHIYRPDSEMMKIHLQVSLRVLRGDPWVPGIEST